MQRGPHNQQRLPVIELGIDGDEQENDRIALENNLSDISIHLSSAHSQQMASPIEYPRTHPGPDIAPVEVFSPFDRVHDHLLTFDDDDESRLHQWSYHPDEDHDEEHVISPYGAHTFSTPGHHASNITLTAGLGGRRELSVSGTEYDPERPVEDMINGFRNISALDIDRSRSKEPAAPVSFEPIVVDDTADFSLARLASPPPTTQIRSPRPTLSDALNRVAFSPKRPRTAARTTSRNSSDTPSSSSSPRSLSPRVQTEPMRYGASGSGPSNAHATHPQQRRDAEETTPRANSRLRNAAPVAQDNEERHHARASSSSPSTTAPSEFTRAAQGLAHDIHEERSRWETPAPTRTAANTRRGPLQDAGNRPQRQPQTPTGPSSPRGATQTHAHRRRDMFGGSGSSVHLPDVTGLTSAMHSPEKARTQYYQYVDDGENVAEVEAHLLSVLNSVQTQLKKLESENALSRRRVRELEFELEECKREVVVERTRVLNATSAAGTGAKAKGKGKAPMRGDQSEEEEEVGERYREVVEQKKALEALIATLRTHLSRLTAEVTEHQELLNSIQAVRDQDVRTLKAKSEEVDRLRKEVERLAGEIEVLRGVVEEGLRERRKDREQSMMREEDEGNGSGESSRDGGDRHGGGRGGGGNRRGGGGGGGGGGDGGDKKDDRHEGDDDEDDQPPPRAPAPRQETPRPTSILLPPSSSNAPSPSALRNAASRPFTPGRLRFVDVPEIHRIQEELSERRSERSSSNNSFGSVGRHSSGSRSGSTSPSPPPRSLSSEQPSSSDRAHSPSPKAPVEDARPSIHSPTRRPRFIRQTRNPPSEGASRLTRRVPPKDSNAAETGTKSTTPPFPQIRGENLEKLFFSAPEHDAKTCATCSGRQRFELNSHDVPPRARSVDSNDDEGYVEGSDDAHDVKGKGKERDLPASLAAQLEAHRRGAEEQLPPQTVLARVLRELEDDFAHYKSIYTELAEQYRIIDAASDVAKRNLLAQHLKEIINILEQKGDHIAALYDLLSFKDKPVSESVVPEKRPPTRPGLVSLGRA